MKLAGKRRERKAKEKDVIARHDAVDEERKAD